MSVNAFPLAAAGALTENVSAKLIAGISGTGAYTYSSALAPGVYTCKAKTLSTAITTPSSVIQLGTSGNTLAINEVGSIFKVSSTESGALLKAYSSNFSTIEQAVASKFAPGINGVYAGSAQGSSSLVGWLITAYNPATGVYVGSDKTSNASYLPQYSTDLKTWTSISIPTLNGVGTGNQYYPEIYYLNNQYVYVFYDNNSGVQRFATSPDLLTWTYAGVFATTGSGMNEGSKFVYFGGYYYGAINNSQVYRSTNLSTWTLVLSASAQVDSLVTNGSSIMATNGTNVSYSSNGTAWTTTSTTNGSFYWGAAQPSGDYMFVNSNGQRIRYNSAGSLTAGPSAYENYQGLAGQDRNHKKVVWHVDKFYYLGRYTWSNDAQGIWPITSGVNYSQDIQIWSNGSTSDGAFNMLSIFSDSTRILATNHTYDSNASGNNYWHNYSVLEYVNNVTLKVLCGTTMKISSTEVNSGGTRVRSSTGGPSRHVEYSLDSGLTWYTRYLDPSFGGTSHLKIYQGINNIFINADGGFNIFPTDQSNYVYSLRFTKNGNSTLNVSYGVTSSNAVTGTISRLAEGVFAFGINNTNMVYSTNFGITWTNTLFQANANSGWYFSAGIYNPLDGLYYGLSGANQYYTSPNLSTWTSVGNYASGLGTVYSITYANKIFVINGSSYLGYSTDMKAVTNTGSTGGSSYLIQYQPDGMWSLSGGSTVLKTSSDGKNFNNVIFTKPANMTGAMINGYYNGKVFYIGSDTGEKSKDRLTSPDVIFELYKMSYGDI